MEACCLVFRRVLTRYEQELVLELLAVVAEVILIRRVLSSRLCSLPLVRQHLQLLCTVQQVAHTLTIPHLIILLDISILIADFAQSAAPLASLHGHRVLHLYLLQNILFDLLLTKLLLVFLLGLL